jgi:homoserine O-acetyltransferase
MRVGTSWVSAAAGAIVSLAAFAAAAADYPAPKEGTFVAKDFRFHTGEVLAEVRLHYRTVGDPSGEPVVVLHGTGGSGESMLTPAFAGELFGEGQPLDATKHFIILPDAIGHGRSRSRPTASRRSSQVQLGGHGGWAVPAAHRGASA